MGDYEKSIDDYNDDFMKIVPSNPFKNKLDKITELKNYTLLFNFDYISVNKTGLCFNNPTLQANDFIRLLERKKEHSSLTFEDLESDKQEYHIHQVLWNRKFESKTLHELCRKLTNNRLSTDWAQLPELFQIAVYTNIETQKAPRIVGFFGKYGVFYLLWFDYDHLLYPSKVRPTM